MPNLVRRALCASIEEARGRPRLGFAPTRVRDVAEVLRRFGFETEILTSPSASTLGRAVYAEIEALGPDDLLIVLVVGHGEVSNAGDLHVVGADGRPSVGLARVADWMKEIENHPEDNPRALFLVDACQAGRAARAAHQLELPATARATVLAACEALESAYDGLFSQALADVLTTHEAGLGNVSELLEHVPLTDLHQDTDDRLQQLIAATRGFAQHVQSNLISLRDAKELPPFFVNRQYLPPDRTLAALRDSVPEATAEIEAIDPGRHFVTRAAGHASGGHGAFTGREEELRRLSAWLDGSAPLCVVTGSPGSGKSALLGVVACAAHPRLAERTRDIWLRAAANAPGVHDLLAVAHARQRGSAEIYAQLAAQLSLPAPETVWDQVSFRAALRALPAPPVLVVDALDEALRQESLAADLLALARSGACRLLLGTRPWDEFAPLLAEAGPALVNLDDTSSEQVSRDIRGYLRTVLRLSPAGRAIPAAVLDSFADATARVLAVRPQSEDRWGEFLVAALAANAFTASPPATAALAREIGLATPRTLPKVMELDLGGRASVRAVLTVLAHARGDGMPIEVVQAALPVLDVRMPAADLRAALAEASFYLRQSLDSDGVTVLYRLFHQALIDDLHDPAREPALLELLRPDWPTAPAYLHRHFVQHAAAADRLASCFDDAGFLVHTDPLTTAPEVALLPDPPLGVHVYQASLGRLLQLGPAERRQILAVDAARFGSAALSRALGAGLDRAPLWATGSAVTTRLRAVLPTPDSCHNISSGTVAGEPALAAASSSAVYLWRIDSDVSRPALVIPGQNIAGPILRFGERDWLLTGGADGTVHGWDAATGEPVWTASGRHREQITRVTAVAGDEPFVVTLDADGAAWIWRPARDAPPVRLPADADLDSVVCGWFHGPVAVTISGADGSARLWSLREPRQIGSQSLPTHPGVRKTDVLHGDELPFALITGADGTWRWDLTTDRLEPFSAEPSLRAALRPDGKAVLVKHPSGDVVEIDLATRRTRRRLPAHDRTMAALAVSRFRGRPVVATSPRGLPGVQLWAVGADGHTQERVARHQPVSGFALSELRGVPTVVAVEQNGPTWYSLRGGDPRGQTRRAVRQILPTGEPGRILAVEADGTARFVEHGRWGPAVLDGLAAHESVTAAATIGASDLFVLSTPAGCSVTTTGRSWETRRPGLLPCSLARFGNRTLLVLTDQREVFLLDLADHDAPLRKAFDRPPAGPVSHAGALRAGRTSLIVAVADDEILAADLADGRTRTVARTSGGDLPTGLECATVGGVPIVAVAGTDTKITLWDARTWDVFETLHLPRRATRFTFAPDGEIVVLMDDGDLVVFASGDHSAG